MKVYDIILIISDVQYNPTLRTVGFVIKKT